MNKVLTALMLSAIMAAPTFAIPILAPGDFIIAVDADGLVSNSSYPGNEAPANVLDGNPATKYLNFAGAGSGFIVTPNFGTSLVQSFTLTTANDAEGRDPVDWELYGTNDAITSADNSTGLAENWTLIDAGTVALPPDRLTVGPVVTVNSMSLYSSYQMIYPTLKGSNLMQVADVAFYPTPDGSGGVNVLSTLDAIIAIHRGWNSRYPGNEAPQNAIDGDINTKYLNFGEQNSGFIVTPGIGPTTLDAFQITTANDAVERDPVVWMLYGTNDAITTVDNGDGTAESWTLICGGTLQLPEERFTAGDMVTIANQAEPYTSYMMQFESVKDGDAANSMQIAEIQLYGIPEPATIALLGFGGLALLRIRKK
ncbi:MAG: PEP-CTERM sorting domain-containing protein [Phycisphaerales bacterium]|nr:MAG: PEP-CTERM sorting domain-containing protein [Phycisphaerales bacterium]